MKHSILNGLLPVMLILVCACDKDVPDNGENELTDGALVATGKALSVEYAEATLLGSIDVNALLLSEYSIGMLWSDDSDIELSIGVKGVSKASTEDVNDNTYSIGLSSLAWGTEYRYRAYLTVNGINYYGKIKSFKTKDISPEMPECKTAVYSSAFSCEFVDYDASAVASLINAKFEVHLGVLTLEGESVRCSRSDGVYCSTGLTPGTEYEYSPYVTFTTKSHSKKYEGKTRRIKTRTVASLSPKAVDLGLSVMWADRNVYADSEEDTGGYYEWGETAQNASSKGVRHNISGTSYDAAHVILGNGWRMPTYSEVKELYDKCAVAYDTVKSMNGIRFTGPSGKDIFLPAAGNGRTGGLHESGEYWCGTYSSGYDSYIVDSSFGFYAYGDGSVNLHTPHGQYSGGNIYQGETIRPVKEY